MFLNEFSENLEKYSNPEEYDKAYLDFKEDLHFIEQYFDHKHETIIELACGTGRLAIPLARQGFNVFAVDIHEGMLQLARKKAEAENLQIHFKLQDCTQLDLPTKARFIYMTGNSFQHFLSNESQNALMQSVKRHLISSGEFVFDTRNPIISELAVVDEYVEKTIHQNGEVMTIQHREEYNHLTQVLTCSSKHKSDSFEYEDTIKLLYISIRA